MLEVRDIAHTKSLFEGYLQDPVYTSSRIRLARNYQDYKFPHKLNLDQKQEVLDQFITGLGKTQYSKEYLFFRIENCDVLEKMILIERHMISHNLVKSDKGSGVCIHRDLSASIMVNEEDHLRYQKVSPNQKLIDLYQDLLKFTEDNRKYSQYAYNDHFGYLTSCLTNTGTGMRASVMLHIPALVQSGKVQALVQALSRSGCVVRGIYGEGTESMGHLFQVSFQMTLGISAQDAIQHVDGVVDQVRQNELRQRDSIYQENKNQSEDKIFRSLAILKYARCLAFKEAVHHLSMVRWGIDYEILDKKYLPAVARLMIWTQPAHIQALFSREGMMTPEIRDQSRAELIRKYFNEEG